MTARCQAGPSASPCLTAFRLPPAGRLSPGRQLTQRCVGVATSYQPHNSQPALYQSKRNPKPLSRTSHFCNYERCVCKAVGDWELLVHQHLHMLISTSIPTSTSTPVSTSISTSVSTSTAGFVVYISVCIYIYFNIYIYSLYLRLHLYSHEESSLRLYEPTLVQGPARSYGRKLGCTGHCHRRNLD